LNREEQSKSLDLFREPERAAVRLRLMQKADCPKRKPRSRRKSIFVD